MVHGRKSVARQLTFLHGDLRLDQLFFAVGAEDAPVRALDWQITAKGRGAFDLGYFLSQSLSAETRRKYEDRTAREVYRASRRRRNRLPPRKVRRDYRLTTAWCFIYPIIGTGQIEIVNERQLALLRDHVQRRATAIEDHDALALRPD